MMAPGMSRAGATAGATAGVISGTIPGTIPGTTPSWPGTTRNGAPIEAVAPGRDHGLAVEMRASAGYPAAGCVNEATSILARAAPLLLVHTCACGDRCGFVLWHCRLHDRFPRIPE
ncbi:hypothetical protein Veis_1839 [Verminephrobacter eiseniae EF01-2]|uniref:Uncharacterized protein n=1 Tax=Verminephrobacter eiseniae (strain EF01-2) TaxID=391735 RepID=A1WIY5_VEREI|nr:hypothetical protein Veis_1839 [Verminephrobacter eiseniae EF01-2]